MAAGRNVQASLDRALAMLEAMGLRGELRLADLARETGASRATAFRTLSTLRARGFVEHIQRSHTYRLGASIRSLAAAATDSAIADLARPAMVQLRRATGETINLIVLRGPHLVYEAVVEGGYVLRTLPRVGQTVAPHCSALGKAVLAEMAASQRDVILGPEPYPRLTERTITTGATLEAELERTRARTYAVDEEETEIGLACIGAVIRGPDRRPVGSISVSGLSDRMRRHDSRELGRRLRSLCDEISSGLASR